MRIWFASGNDHKRAELARILGTHEIRLPSDEGIPFDPDETGSSFVDNALIKARTLYGLVGEPVIADDSGLVVDALDGRPGIRSARYGAELATQRGVPFDAAFRNRLLLDELGDGKNRDARFVCAMVLLWTADRFVVVQETLEGTVAKEGSGTGGFGYDPLLYLPERGVTVAQLSEDEKNAISHRGKAALRIGTLLDTRATP